MKNSIIRMIIFLAIIIVPPALWAGLKYSESDLYDSLQYDLGENRELTHIDEPWQLLTNGSVLTDFYADRAPFRNLLIKANRKINSKIEKPYEKGIMPLVMKIYNKQDDAGKEIEEADNEAVTNDAFSELFGETGNEGDLQTETMENTELQDDELNKTETETHNYELIYSYPATCLADGMNKYKCTDCGAEYEEIIKRKVHELMFLGDIEPSFDDYGCSLYVCTICGQGIKKNVTDKLIDDSFLAPTIKNNEVIMGRSGWLFLAGDGNLPYFTRENVLNEDAMKEYADALSELNEMCKQKGKTLAVIIAPNKDQVYSEYMPTFTFASKDKRTETLVNYIKSNTDVSISYTYSELKYANRYWQTYYKHDSHWNKMGAYIGFQALLKQLGRSVTSPFSVLTIQQETDKVGDLIALGGMEYSEFPKETDYRVDYKPLVQATSLIEGNWDVMTFYQTACETGSDKCVLVGDSYRINMIPYLSKEFSLCSYVYRDNIYEAEEALKDTDIFVIESVERMDFKLIDTARTLTEYLKQQN